MIVREIGSRAERVTFLVESFLHQREKESLQPQKLDDSTRNSSLDVDKTIIDPGYCLNFFCTWLTRSNKCLIVISSMHGLNTNQSLSQASPLFVPEFLRLVRSQFLTLQSLSISERFQNILDFARIASHASSFPLKENPPS
jgi:hypothetical protein